MIEEGVDGAFNKCFDKNRFIGIAGREALHVFDTEKMDFVCADTRFGYRTLIS